MSLNSAVHLNGEVIFFVLTLWNKLKLHDIHGEIQKFGEGENNVKIKAVYARILVDLTIFRAMRRGNEKCFQIFVLHAKQIDQDEDRPGVIHSTNTF